MFRVNPFLSLAIDMYRDSNFCEFVPIVRYNLLQSKVDLGAEKGMENPSFWVASSQGVKELRNPFLELRAIVMQSF